MMEDNSHRKIPKGYFLHISKGTYKNEQDLVRDLYTHLKDITNPAWITIVYEHTLIRDVYVTNRWGDSYSYCFDTPEDLLQYKTDSLGEL